MGLEGISVWLGIWFVFHFFCYIFVGQSVTDGPQRGRLSLRAVSLIHAVLACWEVYETFFYIGLEKLWPPQLYGCQVDVTGKEWMDFTAAYYVWDFLTSLYTRYGWAFVFHGLLSFPVFVIGSVAPNGFLLGFYGRFYHGIFSLSTPWLHMRELLLAAGKEKNPLKSISEYLFAVSFIVVRVVLGTVFSSYFLWQILRALLVEQSVHSQVQALICIVCSAFITGLQLYWFFLEVLPQIKAVLLGGKKKSEK